MPYDFTKYTYDRNSNVLTRVDNGTQAYGSSTETGGRTQQYVYDTADWVTTQFDRGADAGWADDQRITNTFTATGWEDLRIVERATSSTAWDPKQTTDWAYFANGKLRQLTITDDAGTTVESHAVSYVDEDNVYVNGNRTVDDQVLVGPDTSAPCRTAPGCHQIFEYDPRDRLVAYDDGQPAGTDTTYLLDTVGNIASQTDTTGGVAATTSYDYLGGQLQTVTPPAGGEQRYFYDPSGNVACVTLAAGAAADCPVASGQTASANVVAHYTYDYLDRLVSYRGFAPDGSGTDIDRADYEHDALDRVNNQTEAHDGGTSRLTQFGYQGLTRLVAGETQFQGTAPTPAQKLTAKSYAYDAWGHRVSMTDDATDLGDPGTGDPAAKPYTYAYDVHGNVSLLLDQAGTASASYGYRPYGAADDALTAGDFDPSDPDEHATREDNPLNAFRYSGRRLDTGSGSIDMGARRYGPDTGRFLQRDFLNGALGDLGLALDPLTQGRYNFAGGNPISFVEWDGHIFLLDGGGGCVCGIGGGIQSPPPDASDSEDPIGALGEGLGGVVDAFGSAIGGVGNTLQCVSQFECVADAAVSTGSGVAGGVGTFVGDPLGTVGGAFNNAAGAIGQAHSNLTSTDPRLRGRQVGGIFITVFSLGLGPKAVPRGTAGTGRAGAELAAAGLAAETRVSQAIGVGRNVGSGRATIPGSGPGGYRVPDFDPNATIAARGSVVEVKDVAHLSSSAQLRDLMAYARSRGVPLEIFTNATLPSRGDLFHWSQQSDLILNSIP